MLSPRVLDLSIVVVAALILVMLVLFVRQTIPVPMTALLAPVVLVGAGILTTDEGLSGFSSQATIAVLAMFVLSAGVQRTGAVSWLADRLSQWAGKSHTKQVLALGAAAGPISGFVNNTPVVAVMIPAVMQMARRTGISPSRLLMPVSSMAMLGGLLTVIGSSTNLLGNATLRRFGITPFGFFEFTIIGVIALAVGLVYYATLGRLLVPDRGSGDVIERFDLKGFFGEFIVQEEILVGKTLREAGLTFAHGILVVRVSRGDQTIDAPAPWTTLRAGDAVLVEASRQTLLDLQQKEGLETLPEVQHPLELDHQGVDLATAEVVITVSSRYVGRTVAQIDFRRTFGAQVLAVRHHARVQLGTLRDSPLRPGDVLLIQAPLEDLERMREQPDLFVTRERPREGYRVDRLVPTLSVVVGVVAVAAFGWMDISMAALAGAVLLVLLGCLRLEEFWSAIHWDIIFLLAGIIPVGIALEKTGAAALLAERLVGVGGFLPPIAFLVLLFLLTTLITELVSNNASVVLLLPIVIAAAVALGLDPRPVSLVVMLAASTSMMTPIGYQTNTMIYGPGNYRFADFARAGGPLNLILAVVIPLAVAWRFPL